jgi:hypothetical protein
MEQIVGGFVSCHHGACSQSETEGVRLIVKVQNDLSRHNTSPWVLLCWPDMRPGTAQKTLILTQVALAIESPLYYSSNCPGMAGPLIVL